MNQSSAHALDQTESGVFNAYITNPGKYNEGELVGEWVSFPTTTQEMKDVFDRIGLDGIRYEEYFITDYDCPNYSDLHDCLGEYENLNELNYMAQCIEESNIDGDMLNGMICIEGANCAADIINLVQNEDCFSVLSHVHDESDLGYYYVEEAGIYDLSGMGNLSSYIDYERFGRDIAMESSGQFTDAGFMEQMDSMTEYYSDHDDIPEEAYVTNFSDLEIEEPDLKMVKSDPER